MTDREMLRKALEISSLFEGLGFEENWFFRDFKREDIISEEQNGVACIGLILRGSAKVAPGEQGAVSTIGRGAEFGICNIFVREDMPTRLTAKTALKAAFLPKDVFAGLLGENRVLMYRYIRLCNQKMLYLAGKLRLMSISDSTERFAFWLMHNGKNGHNGAVMLSFSKDELARRLGLSRASLFRAISKLENEGIISSIGNKIIILNPQADIFERLDSQ